jgi:CheY-like chemotaxis protein
MLASGDGTNGSVLVVDDDEDIREALSMILEAQGYLVLSATDGFDALRVLRATAVLPGLILLDLRMPVMNGPQFREEQLRDPAIAAIPVVVITADRSPAAYQSIVGAADLLLKPLELEEVLQTAKRFLECA